MTKRTRRKNKRMTQSEINNLLEYPATLFKKEGKEKMTRFDFPEPKRPTAKFQHFEPMKAPKGNKIVKGLQIPLLTILKNRLSFNSYFKHEVLKIENYKFAQFTVQDNLLGIRFSGVELENSVEIKNVVGGTKQQAYLSNPILRTYLKENTDFLNLDAFSYTFRLKWDENNVYYIELDNPYSKYKLPQ